ncbi:Hypothetical Protein FCC1311_014442 [Hondaea fermentalgiana]|uniref:Uncharacterized protein n=1 Tax=Hondaea fermentalgiana TaxID=2315210 RepID=A0A2R5G2H6_9STRA|nr:Hypothetical Protein FCC1311_014442 [Hondaea fermentalgiana]|eukprot:GBG25227.1 Hypothetical Protein FCC1311_014442 [Hondaea fermentalgiana]
MSFVPYLKPVAGDASGLVQVMFDNIGTILALVGATYYGVFGFAANDDVAYDIIYQRILPGLGVSTLVGGAFYAVQGAILSAKEDRLATALPYGINTPGAFAVLFGIMGPVYWADSASCASGDTACIGDAMEAAWRAGVTTNFLVGIISVVLSFFGPAIRKFTPPVALLGSLSGIGMAFLVINALSNTYAEPIAGLVPLFLVFILYYGDVNIGNFPKSLVIILAGTALAWMDGVHTKETWDAAEQNLKWWGIQTGFSALSDWSSVADSIGTVFPVAFTAAAGTLMNVYSAEQAGDKYGVTLTMVSDGLGTVIAALFGCPFSTSVYIGHPAYKKMGAGTMYSVINGVILFIFSLTGMFAIIQAIVPMQAVGPLLVFVGLAICQEAIVSASVREYPAFIIGIVPSIVDWTLQGSGYTADSSNATYYGFTALDGSPLLIALVTISMASYAINRSYVMAAVWSVVAAFLSLFGFIHQGLVSAKEINEVAAGGVYCADATTVIDASRFSEFDTCATGYFPTLSWRFFTAYLMLTAIFLGLFQLQRMGKVDPTIEESEDEIDSRVDAAKVDHAAA